MAKRTGPKYGCTVFDHKVVEEHGAHIHYRIGTCRECEKVQWWKDGKFTGAPDELVAQGFRKLGWEMDVKGRGTCPKCIAKRRSKPIKEIEDMAITTKDDETVVANIAVAKTKPALTPAQKRAVYLKYNPPHPKPEIVPASPTVKETPVTIADPPRQPTRDDRRRILGALDAHYIVQSQCYAASFTDEVLAQTLKVPRAWVAEERDRAYGPPGNEADVQKAAELAELIAKLPTLRDAAMAAAEAALNAATRIDELLADAKGRNVA